MRSPIRFLEGVGWCLQYKAGSPRLGASDRNKKVKIYLPSRSPPLPPALAAGRASEKSPAPQNPFTNKLADIDLILAVDLYSLGER